MGKQTGDASIDYWHGEDPIEQIEEYLDMCGLDKGQVGMVVGPRVNDDLPGIELEVNIRVLDGDDKALYSIDGIYSFKEMKMDQFMDEIYQEFIEDLERSFPESSLYYYEP